MFLGNLWPHIQSQTGRQKGWNSEAHTTNLMDPITSSKKSMHQKAPSKAQQSPTMTHRQVFLCVSGEEAF